MKALKKGKLRSAKSPRGDVLHRVDEQFLIGRISMGVAVVAEGDADDAVLRVLHGPHARERVLPAVRGVVAADVHLGLGLDFKAVVPSVILKVASTPWVRGLSASFTVTSNTPLPWLGVLPPTKRSLEPSQRNDPKWRRGAGRGPCGCLRSRGEPFEIRVCRTGRDSR